MHTYVCIHLYVYIYVFTEYMDTRIYARKYVHFQMLSSKRLSGSALMGKTAGKLVYCGYACGAPRSHQVCVYMCLRTCVPVCVCLVVRGGEGDTVRVRESKEGVGEGAGEGDTEREIEIDSEKA